MSRPVALVTGATSGLGAGFARHLAAAGHDLVLVARDRGRLDAAAGELREGYRAGVDVLTADLATADGRQPVIARLQAGVDMLVNNAGFGIAGDFWSTEPDLLQQQLAVNCAAVLALTRAALPPMLATNAGAIINLGSIAGILSGRATAYSATKAWVIALTEGLAANLADTGVRLQALCPGWVHTEFHDRAGITMRAVPDFLWLEVDDVVRASLADLRRGKVVCVPSLAYKTITAANRFLPKALMRRATSAVGRSGH
jgi:short-subunit dehydrogenase